MRRTRKRAANFRSPPDSSYGARGSDNYSITNFPNYPITQLPNCQILSLVPVLVETVHAIPVPVLAVGWWRHSDASVEAREGSRPVRERAQAKTCRQVQRAAADGSIAAARVENHIAVQHASGDAGRLIVNDQRPHDYLRDVGSGNRAERAGCAGVLRALLRHMKPTATLVML